MSEAPTTVTAQKKFSGFHFLICPSCRYTMEESSKHKLYAVIPINSKYANGEHWAVDIEISYDIKFYAVHCKEHEYPSHNYLDPESYTSFVARIFGFKTFAFIAGHERMMWNLIHNNYSNSRIEKESIITSDKVVRKVFDFIEPNGNEPLVQICGEVISKF